MLASLLKRVPENPGGGLNLIRAVGHQFGPEK